MHTKNLRRAITILIACLTLGLAPFTPEPHIWMDLKWVWNGAVGMKFMNWFDLLLHGTPWVWLGVHLIIWYRKSQNLKRKKS